MRSLRSVAPLVVVLAVVFAASRVNAQATWDGRPAPQPAQPPPPAPYPYGGPAYGAPGYGAAPYGAPAYGLNAQNMFIYENEKKSALLALALEWFVPGVGSLYADHTTGAVITWVLTIGGIVAIAYSLRAPYDPNTGTAPVDGLPLTAGIFMILGGRIYGMVDAYQSTGEYNRSLAQRLGLPAGVAVLPAPIVAGPTTAWGPSVSLRF